MGVTGDMEILGFTQHDWAVLLGCFVFQCCYVFGMRYIFMHIVKTQYKCPQKLSAWTITSLTGPVMSAISLYLIYIAVEQEGIDIFYSDFDGFKRVITSQPYMSRFVGLYFIAHCATDLVLGQILYPKELDMLSCYLHHTIYAYVVHYMIVKGSDNLFGLLSCVELANICMAVGNIHTPWRFDWTFGIVWFLIRICFHACVARMCHVTMLTHSPLAVYVAWGGLGMHVWWWWGWAKGKLGLKKKKIEKKVE
eukprot:GDKI01019610.1.p1 GENE.GDKI01019610.1~~GDKI01019610.1.p1  ORF type:complete len:269 (-),score=43.21 GDKI01019610.1:101-853(-)